jgi:hypothetical protein
MVDRSSRAALEARERAILVGAGEPAITDDIRNQNRRELSGLAHRAPLFAKPIDFPNLRVEIDRRIEAVVGPV